MILTGFPIVPNSGMNNNSIIINNGIGMNTGIPNSVFGSQPMLINTGAAPSYGTVPNQGIIQQLLASISECLSKIFGYTQDSSGNMGGFWNNTMGSIKRGTKKVWNGTKRLANKAWDGIKGGFSSVVEFAKAHLGMRNDGRFSQGRNESWCADFVNTSYEKTLGGVPWGYRDKAGNYKSSVSELQNWGKKEGLYSSIEQSRAMGFADVKKGDIFIQKRNGSSHTGIVDRIDPDGTIHTIEGNSSNKVAQRTYRPGSSGYNKIDGFVRVNEYMSTHGVRNA